MTPKLVANIRRSLSFQSHPSSSTKSPKRTSHLRSSSLPTCISYPLISHLKDPKLWSSDISKPENQLTSAQICDGLTGLKSIHESLDDLLQLPQTRESLHQNPEWVEKVLEHFLEFIDIYGIFQSLVLTLKQEISAARVALRRKDDSKARVYLKAMKKTAKETVKLVSSTQSILHNLVPESECMEVCGVIRNVVEATVMVSRSLFSGISSSFSSRRMPLSWLGLKYSKKAREEDGIMELNLGMGRLWGMRRENDEEVKRVMKKMKEMEICISGIECGCQKVFRSLIHTRVSLLNVLTQ